MGDSGWVGDGGKDKGMETRVGDELEDIVSEKISG